MQNIPARWYIADVICTGRWDTQLLSPSWLFNLLNCPFHYPGVHNETPLLPLKEKLNLLFLRNSILPLKQLVLVLNKKCTVIAGFYTPN